MKLPTTLAFPALTLSLLVTASAGLAETLFTDLDLNMNGLLDQEELDLAGYPPEQVALLDLDGDGRLSQDEASAGNEDPDGEDPTGEPVDSGLVDDGDGNHGHGNSPDGFDTDNPGRGHGDGVRGGGNGNSNRDGTKHSSDD